MLSPSMPGVSRKGALIFLFFTKCGVLYSRRFKRVSKGFPAIIVLV